MRIQMKRGLQAKLPQFEEAEFGVTTDTQRAFFGSSRGNIELSRIEDLNSAISALGVIPKRFDQLQDVDSSLRSDGQTLIWDAIAGKLKFQDLPVQVVLVCLPGDQSSRIQAALKTFGNVVLGEGTWNIGKAVVMDGTVGSANYVPAGRLSGKGRTKTIIKAMGAGYHAIHLLSNSHCIVTDLKVQDVAMGPDTNERHGIRVESCTDCTITRNWVDNIDDAGIRFSSKSDDPADKCMRNFCYDNKVTNVHGGSGVEIIRADYITVFANKITGSLQHGIRVNGTTGSIIQANHLWDNIGDDISIQGYSNTGVSPAILFQPAQNVITENILYDTRASSQWVKGIDMFNDTHDTVVVNNNIRNKKIGILLRSSNNQGVYDCLVSNNFTASCNVGVAALGNVVRCDIVYNTIKDWTDLVDGGISITSSQAGIHIDGWTGFSNTPGISAQMFIAHNRFINDTDTTVRAIAVRRTTTPITIVNNRYSIKTPATNVIEKISGSGTLNTTFNSVETNLNLGWSAINMTYTP